MRLAVTACAVVIALCLGVFGFLLASKAPTTEPSAAPDASTSAASAPAVVVRQVEERPEFPRHCRTTIDHSSGSRSERAAGLAADGARTSCSTASSVNAAAGCRASAGRSRQRVLPRQSECARRHPHGRDRHHGRSRFRLRAFQAARLPAQQGSGADLRRWPVAAHHGRAQGAGRRMRARRPSSRSASTPPTTRKFSSRSPQPVTRSARTPGRTRTSSKQDPSKKPRPRSKRASARWHGGRRARRRRSSASRRCAIRRSSSPISASATSRIFSTDMDSFDFKMRKPEQVVQGGDDQAQEARQRHRADARLPDGTAQAVPNCSRTQGRRLQDRAHEAKSNT